MKKHLLWRTIKVGLIKADEARREAIRLKALLENRGKPVIRTIHESRMYLNPKDRGLSTDLLADKTREEEAAEEYRKMLKAGMTIADIGANMGYYALMESKIIGEKGRIYAIEPVPSNVEILRKNIKLNNYNNIELSQLAIGNSKGCTKFWLSPLSNWGHVTRNEETEKGNEIEVEITTLDEFLKDRAKPDMVRMDVEGHELEVLKGMKQTLKKPNLALFIEVHECALKKKGTAELLSILKENGFRTCKVIKKHDRKMAFVSKFVPKKVMPTEAEFRGSIDKLIENPPDNYFHLFVEKGTEKATG